MANKKLKLVRVLPWLALGPITGILGWRMHGNFQTKNHLLAILYGLAILVTSAALVSSVDDPIFSWLK